MVMKYTDNKCEILFFLDRPQAIQFADRALLRTEHCGYHQVPSIRCTVSIKHYLRLLLHFLNQLLTIQTELNTHVDIFTMNC